MNDVRLIYPNADYLDSYLGACREAKENNLVGIGALNDPDDFQNWKSTLLINYENRRLGINLGEGFVPVTTFWLVDKNDFIGLGNIRHRLTENLEKYGGHIGYCIRVSKWNNGYGSYQLNLLLKEAFKLDINPALITCDENNIGSIKVIENNGGELFDTIDNVIDGNLIKTRRYWLSTST